MITKRVAVAFICGIVAGCSSTRLDGVQPNTPDSAGPSQDATLYPDVSRPADDRPDASDPRRVDAAGDAQTAADSAADGAVDGGVDMADMTPDADVPPPVPYCVIGCQAPADCVLIAGELWNEDNYDCDAGACRYLGCISDAECISASGAGYMCITGAFGFKSCLPTCTVPTDCAQPGTTAYDADNYECVQSRCEYQGCNNDAECQPNFSCLDGPAGIPICLRTCQVPADCATGTGAYDADNYACSAGACEYLGCQSDAECQTIGPAFLCR